MMIKKADISPQVLSINCSLFPCNICYNLPQGIDGEIQHFAGLEDYIQWKKRGLNHQNGK